LKVGVLRTTWTSRVAVTTPLVGCSAVTITVDRVFWVLPTADAVFVGAGREAWAGWALIRVTPTMRSAPHTAVVRWV
jgi:hypothetical protein